MASTEASIHVKLGHLEIEYKGDPSFLEGPLLELCKELIALQKQNPQTIEQATREAAAVVVDGAGHSTDTFATLLGRSSGANLAIAAAAHLHFAKGLHRFSRKELTNEMKTAPGHYKATFLANLTGTLKRLTSNGHLLYGDQKYSLSKNELQSLEAKLAQA
jgi:hypothetical protein